jgi:hypothetical protein
MNLYAILSMLAIKIYEAAYLSNTSSALFYISALAGTLKVLIIILLGFYPILIR